jgi:hypothetical protein
MGRSSKLGEVQSCISQWRPQLFTRIGIGQLLGPVFDKEIKSSDMAMPHTRAHKDTLVMVADFSGQHRAQFETYAFLVFDLSKNHE